MRPLTPFGAFFNACSFSKTGTNVLAQAFQTVIFLVEVSTLHRLHTLSPVPQMTLFVADFGTNNWTVLNSASQTTTTMSPEDFLSLRWISEGDTLVAENAHLGCVRTDLSLAQVYTKPLLTDFYGRAARKGCTVKLFPGHLTPKARAQYGGGEKSDDVDTRAIHHMVTNSPHVRLMNPPVSFEPTRSREAGWKFKDETNAILNKARRFKYQDPDDAIVQFLAANLKAIAAGLSPAAQEAFDFDKISKRSGDFLKSDGRINRLYTLTAFFLHPNGTVRQRPDTGAMPGMQWLRRNVLHTSPFHFRGGIARSNIYWHGFKNYALKKMGTRKASSIGKVLSHYDFTNEQDQEFRAHRKVFTGAMIEAMQVIRDLVREQRNGK
jgi:hypothetical protein